VGKKSNDGGRDPEDVVEVGLQAHEEAAHVQEESDDGNLKKEKVYSNVIKMWLYPI
jgi:hypothetical protein